MLVSAKEPLGRAYREHYAVGAFNVFNMETAIAVVRAAVALRSPAIVQISEKAFAYSDRELVSRLVREVIAQAPEIPLVLNLDHGRSVEVAHACIDGGYTSVMFDGSQLPFEENIASSAGVAAYAHTKGVTVQAELGRLPKSAHDAAQMQPSDYMTDPSEAADFCARTGVDFLAVAIGNIHGISPDEPRIDLARLAEIRKAVSIPLVLHGGSGIPEEDIRTAIASGIAEINIDTEIRLAFTGALRKSIAEHPHEIDPRVLLAPTMPAVQALVEQKMRLFGSVGKA